MKPSLQTAQTIDEYIAGFPPQVRQRLEQMRRTIHEAAPQATEKISYQMPTFFLEGNLVHFAAHANHIGFYPAPTGIAGFQEELARYGSGKGSVQFPLDEDLPLDLVRRITLFRVDENLKKAQAKKDKKKK